MKQTTLFCRSASLQLAFGGASSSETDSQAPTVQRACPSSASRSSVSGSDASSILSSAEAYQRRDNEKKVNVKKEAFEVRIKLNLRFVHGAGGIVVSTLSLKREALQVFKQDGNSLKSKRRKYDLDAKKAVGRSRSYARSSRGRSPSQQHTGVWPSQYWHDS